MRILIVEDDITSRTLMKRYLARHGTCEVAVDGIEALEIFLTAHKENNPFRLICLDIMMPKLDGLSTLRAIRDFENQKKIPEEKRAMIIMTTALNDQQTVNESYELGCEAFAWKPIDVQKFTEVLEKLGLI